MKEKKYFNHPTENIPLREGKEPKPFRTEYQNNTETKTKRNQKFIKRKNKNWNLNLIRKKIKQNTLEPSKENNLEGPNCKQRNSIERFEGFFWEYCDIIVYKQKHQLDKKVQKQNENFSK